MGTVSSTILAFSMSADAFAVSISKAAQIKKPNWKKAIKTAAVFGSIEGIAPLLGWTLGRFASNFIQDIDHWIAFGILATIGIKFIMDAFFNNEDAEPKSTSTKTPKLLALAAIATSIDAFAVGISLSFVDHNILTAAISIACATFTMVFIGTLSGHFLGKKMGKYAEILGGIGLICIGSKILLDHLHII